MAEHASDHHDKCPNQHLDAHFDQPGPENDESMAYRLADFCMSARFIQQLNTFAQTHADAFHQVSLVPNCCSSLLVYCFRCWCGCPNQLVRRSWRAAARPLLSVLLLECAAAAAAGVCCCCCCWSVPAVVAVVGVQDFTAPATQSISSMFQQ